MRRKLHQLEGSGASNGQVPVWNAATDEWVPGTKTITAGTYIVVNAADPSNIIVTAMVPLTTLNSSGLPEIVFDSDGHIVYTEAP